jgi:hypothetical protein
MAMVDLVNPFEEIVVFGKAHSYDLMYGGPPRAVTITRRPGTRGTGLRLKHVHNSAGKGGPATRLQHYSKAFNPRDMFGGPASRQMPGHLRRRGVARGLALASNAKGIGFGSAGSKGSKIAS